MSLRPPKKSDLGKSWMQPRRGKIKRIQPEYHLIVSEGTNTEPAYFTSIKNAINAQYKGKIQLDILGIGDNTLNLLQKTRKRVASSPNIYSHVWLIYDTDDFPAENVDKVAEMAEVYSNDETKYHAVRSNQCIELWFLLHFSYMQSDLHRTEYYPKLTDCLKNINAGEYKKNRTDMYHILYPFMDNAIANAKRLAQYNSNKPPSKSTPGTKLHELIQKLKPYLS